MEGRETFRGGPIGGRFSFQWIKQTKEVTFTRKKVGEESVLMENSWGDI